VEREPRLEHAASWEAIHEAGHVVERFTIHGTTGAIRPNPLPGKAAGAESELLPKKLLKPGTQALRDPPYSSDEVARLKDEIKTTLEYAFKLAKRLWDYDDIVSQMGQLVNEVEGEIDAVWPAVVAVAEAYERSQNGLTGAEVMKIVC
jgi:hypothetical protein